MIRAPAPSIDPGEALRRLSRGERPFLLDGAIDADGLGRFSIAGCDPVDGIVWRLGDAGEPFALLADAERRWRAGPVDEHPWPMAVGYLSYDVGAHELARRSGRRLSAVDELGTPDIDFARYPAVWRFDRSTGRAEVLALDGGSAERLLARLLREPPPLATIPVAPLVSQLGAAGYGKAIDRVLEYLRAGDCYQVNFAHRLRAPVADDEALPIFLALRRTAPAPLGSFLRTDGFSLLSNSPELLLRQRGSRVETRPIKGTRRRDADPERDGRLADELVSSPKDAAEHLMIVDLERNDLGQLARVGSVMVDGFARRVELPTVHHLVSTVRAELEPTVTLQALLSAMLPGGSITGAPKLRAVEIIDELERLQRGPYCGAIGWLGAGRLDLALAIRTACVTRGELVLAVGGGIVADSHADDEWAETHVKAAAFARVLGG